MVVLVGIDGFAGGCFDFLPGIGLGPWTEGVGLEVGIWVVEVVLHGCFGRLLDCRLGTEDFSLWHWIL